MKLRDIVDKLMPMLEDARWAEELLESKDDQFIRRAYIRNVFSMIEGTIWVLKQTVLHAPTKDGRVKSMKASEYALLSDSTYDLKSNGEPRIQVKYLKLPENMRFTFKAMEKYFNARLDLGIGTEKWEKFLQAQAIRNRIVHPKTPSDYEVTDNEIAVTQEVCSWFNELVHGFIAGIVTETKGKEV